ncbi:hypothetical protein [Amycolatopsis kentuckyensis]|uniref:hypothetical protein n=1 Tax=Amycolatopsis kentuckyensis TaxID=218823 RepID=UPI0035613A60
MNRRSLGATGPEVSELGFGTVHTALELGITFFDVSPFYGNAETVLGPHHNVLDGNVKVADGNWPAAAQDVMRGAGITPARR